MSSYLLGTTVHRATAPAPVSLDSLRRVDGTLLQELEDWLRIPSVSTDGGDAEAIERAAEWALERVRAAGGECELVRGPGANPLVVGELRACDSAAPTVLIYGH